MSLFENVLSVKHDGVDSRHLLKHHQHGANRQGLVDAGVHQVRQLETGALEGGRQAIKHHSISSSETLFIGQTLTISSQASSMRAHSYSMGASGPRKKRRASSASRLLPFDSRKRGVSGIKHIQTMSSVGGMEQQIASQRQSKKRPAGNVCKLF